jgi:hypothetical protein
LVEQWIENPCVGGSSPPLGTTFANLESVSFINLGLTDFCFDSEFDSNWDQFVSRPPIDSGLSKDIGELSYLGCRQETSTRLPQPVCMRFEECGGRTRLAFRPLRIRRELL